MKLLFKEIKGWKQGYIQYFKYSWLMTVWIYRKRGERFFRYLKIHEGLIRRAVLLLAGWIAATISTHFGILIFMGDTLSSYLVSVAAMTGGTIAIIFTLSIFLLQGVADLYSSKHLEEYANSWLDKLVYIVVILITLGIFGTGLYVGGTSNISPQVSTDIVYVSLVLIGLVFALIDWQYALVKKKISPANAVIFLRKKCSGFLNKLQRNAESIAKLLMAQDNSLTTEVALGLAYNRALKPLINDLDKQLETLVEISLKLADREEVETTKLGFNSVYNLLVRFFEARKTSSFVLSSPTTFLAVESDSQKFLSNTFERLNNAGSKFITEGKNELATHIVDVYSGLAVAAKEINHVGHQNENPILELIIGYLNFHVKKGVETKNLDVMFQGSRVQGEIAVMAAEKGLSNTLHGLQDEIQKSAVAGLVQQQSIIYDQCSLVYLKIIRAVFHNKHIDRHIQIKNALDHIATITNYINTLIQSGVLQNNITNRFSWSKAYDNFYEVLVDIEVQYGKLTDVREKKQYRSDLVHFFDELYMSLRTLSEKVKSCDTVLTDSIGRLLYNVNTLIIDLIGRDEFSDEKENLKRRLSANIHLPSWFVSSSASKFDGGSMHLYSLTDSVTKTGLLVANELNDKKLAQDAIDCLYSITKNTLEHTNSTYGYDEVRVLKKACYLGIIAQKKDWVDVVANLKAKIQEFETMYFIKHLTGLPTGLPEGFDPHNHNIMGLPHHDQLLREIREWRDDFEHELLNGLRIQDDAEAMMYGIAEEYDIDKFIFEVWGSYDVEGRFGQEMEQKIVTEKAEKIKKEGGRKPINVS
jgi:hypothetical protein